MNADTPPPGLRTIVRWIRTAPLETVRNTALAAPGDEKSNDANEWYWVSRCGHPLVDHIEIRGLLSVRMMHAKDLTQEELDHLTADDLEVLALSESATARVAAAGHPRTTAEVLEALAEDPTPVVRRSVGHNPVTPADVILRMHSRSRFAGAHDEIEASRLRWLWTEIDTAPLDPELAMEVAQGTEGDDDKRLALARRKQLPVDIRATLASGPRLSAEVAEILSRDTNESVRLALAGNFRTPKSLLASLSQDSNPTVRIAAGCNFNLPEENRQSLLDDVERRVRDEVIVKAPLSHAILLRLDEDDDARQGLHSRLRSGVGGWADSKYFHWRHNMDFNSKELESIAELEQFLRELSASPRGSTRAAVAMNPDTPIDVLEKLAEDDDETVTRAVDVSMGIETEIIYSPRTYVWWYRREFSASETSQLVKSSSSRLRSAVAGRLPRGEHLASLCRDSDPLVRAASATNSSLAFDDLLALVDDPDERVRHNAAVLVSHQLKACERPPEDTRAHGQFEHWGAWLEYVKARLSLRRPGDERELRFGEPWLSHAYWPMDEALDRLAATSNAAVRASVVAYSGSHASRIDRSASDLKLSPEALLRLLTDSEVAVRAAALTNSGPSAERVATTPHIPIDALIAYARSTAANIRQAVASNPKTPGPVLANLTRDRATTVRTAVAANLATPREALEVLTADSSDDVLAALLSNPNTPSEFLAQQALRPADRTERARQQSIASNPSSPSDILRRLAYSQWDDVRLRVAGNPRTAVETLDILAFDEHARVRDEVERRRRSH